MLSAAETAEIGRSERCILALGAHSGPPNELACGYPPAGVAIFSSLLAHGPQLGFPYSSAVVTSRHSHMRELRVQHGGRPYRILYAFDPRRNAILLIGGEKTGMDRWYEEFVPIADDLYDEHLRQLRREGLI